MWIENKGKYFIYKAQDWTEHFRIYVSGLLIRSKREGDMMPRFYLPVWKSMDRDAIECWIFPLAPFVLFWRITSHVLWIIWRDLLDFLYMLYKWTNTKSSP